MTSRRKIELLALESFSFCLIITGYMLMRLGMAKSKISVVLTGFFALLSGLLGEMGIIGYIIERHKVEAEEPCDLE